MKRSILLTIFSALFFLMAPFDVEACSCVGRPQGVKGVQTCGYYWGSTDVFIGVAETVEIDPKSHSMKVTFTVERSIRGTSEAKVEIFTSASTASCGYPFKQGERYFVYGRKDSQGKYRESLCGPTTLLKDAEDDLEYATDIDDGKLGTRIWGRVFEDWQPTSEDQRKSLPLSGVEITIKNSKYTFTTVTNENGSYLFKDVPRGPYDLISDGSSVLDKSKDSDRVNFSAYSGGYQVFAKLPKGYRELFTRQDLTEHFAGGCDGENFRVTRKGSIRGRVVKFPSREIRNPWNRDAVQQPKVTLMPLDESGQPFKHYAFEERWAYRDKFEYFFDSVPAGKYLLAINPRNCSYPNNGIPPMFYPGVATQAQARVITVKEGQQMILDDFRSLPMLKERWIAGRVLLPDGTPAANARVKITDGHPGSERCSNGGNLEVRTDASGTFRVKGYEGYTYTIQASTQTPNGRTQRYAMSMPVPNDPQQELEIVLDRSF